MNKELLIVSIITITALLLCACQSQAAVETFASQAERSLKACKQYYTSKEERHARFALIQAQRLTALDVRSLRSTNQQLLDRLADDALHHAHNDTFSDIGIVRFETLLAIDQAEFGTENPALVWTLNRLAICRLKQFANNYAQERRNQCEQLALRALGIIQREHAENSSEYCLNLSIQFQLYRYAQDWPKVEQLANLLLDQQLRPPGTNPYGREKSIALVYAFSQARLPQKTDLYGVLAWSQYKQGKLDQATRNYKLAIARSKSDNVAVLPMEAELINLLLEQKQLPEAESVAVEAIAATDPQDVNYSFKKLLLANILQKQSQYKKAIVIYDEIRRAGERALKLAKPRGYESQSPVQSWESAAELFVSSSEGLAECKIGQKEYQAAKVVLQHALDVCNGFRLDSASHLFGPGSACCAELRKKMDETQKLCQ